MADHFVIVLPSLTLGGAEKQALHYALALRAEGFHISIVGLGKKGSLATILDEHGIQHFTYSAQAFHQSGQVGKLLFLLRYALFVRNLKPDVIIGFTYWANLLTGSVWPLTGASRFYWNQRSVDSQVAVSRVEKFAAKLKPRYLANGTAPAKHIALRHGLHDEQQVIIVRNYLESFTESTIASERTDSDQEIHFIMVANFFPEKDHETVLRSFKKFVDDSKTPPAYLHFVGEAPGISAQEEICKALAFELNLCGHVTFHGKVANVKTLLQKCHIGILSTRSEGVSNAILEYVLFGLPVIATDILANRDALARDDYEWLFPVGNETRLFELMKEMSIKSNLVQIASENHQRITEKHNGKKFKEELKNAFA